MTTWAILVAAGSGSRFGGAKQYEALGPVRVVDHALAAARAACDGVVLVVSADQLRRREPGADVVVAGGATRSASTRAGLAVVPADASIVVVHDGARPLAGPELFGAVIAAVEGGADAAVPVVDVVDSIRRIDGGAIDRSTLVAVQTPQAFEAELLRRAHRHDPDASDDASLVEAIGGKVMHVDGDPDNLKVTRPADLILARALLGGAGG